MITVPHGNPPLGDYRSRDRGVRIPGNLKSLKKALESAFKGLAKANREGRFESAAKWAAKKDILEEALIEQYGVVPEYHSDGSITYVSELRENPRNPSSENPDSLRNKKGRALFAVRVGNEDWQEELITEVDSRIEAASAWALANGFDRLRVVEWHEDEIPDFGRRSLAKTRGRRNPSHFPAGREDMYRKMGNPRGKKPSDRLRDQERPEVLGYELDRETLTPVRKTLDLDKPGDYGQDPLGPDPETGKFMYRMVPSGDIVDEDELKRRKKKNPDSPYHACAQCGSVTEWPHKWYDHASQASEWICDRCMRLRKRNPNQEQNPNTSGAKQKLVYNSLVRQYRGSATGMSQRALKSMTQLPPEEVSDLMEKAKEAADGKRMRNPAPDGKHMTYVTQDGRTFQNLKQAESHAKDLLTDEMRRLGAAYSYTTSVSGYKFGSGGGHGLTLPDFHSVFTWSPKNRTLYRQSSRGAGTSFGPKRAVPFKAYKESNPTERNPGARGMSKKTKTWPGRGLKRVWSPVNQAYLLIWGDDHVLGVFNTAAEVEAAVKDLETGPIARSRTIKTRRVNPGVPQKRNLEGYVDSQGRFRPIRASADYDPGENDEPSHWTGVKRQGGRAVRKAPSRKLKVAKRYGVYVGGTLAYISLKKEDAQKAAKKLRADGRKGVKQKMVGANPVSGKVPKAGWREQFKKAARVQVSRSRNPRGGSGGEVDSHGAAELELYIIQSSELYPRRQAIEANLAKKMAKGTYKKSEAPKLWKYLVDDGAKRYAKEFASPGDWNQIFSVPTRNAVARSLAASFEAEAPYRKQNPSSGNPYPNDTVDAESRVGKWLIQATYYPSTRAVYVLVGGDYSSADGWYRAESDVIAWEGYPPNSQTAIKRATSMARKLYKSKSKRNPGDKRNPMTTEPGKGVSWEVRLSPGERSRGVFLDTKKEATSYVDTWVKRGPYLGAFIDKYRDGRPVPGAGEYYQPGGRRNPGGGISPQIRDLVPAERGTGRRNPKFIGEDIPGAYEIEANASQDYPSRIRLTYSQAKRLPPHLVMKSLDTSDRGARGTLAKRWYRWFASADAILGSDNSTKNMLDKAQGVGLRPGGRGRRNPKRRRSYFVSVPRTSLTESEGRNFATKAAADKQATKLARKYGRGAQVIKVEDGSQFVVSERPTGKAPYGQPYSLLKKRNAKRKVRTGGKGRKGYVVKVGDSVAWAGRLKKDAQKAMMKLSDMGKSAVQGFQAVIPDHIKFGWRANFR